MKCVYLGAAVFLYARFYKLGSHHSSRCVERAASYAHSAGDLCQRALQIVIYWGERHLYELKVAMARRFEIYAIEVAVVRGKKSYAAQRVLAICVDVVVMSSPCAVRAVVVAHSRREFSS